MLISKNYYIYRIKKIKLNKMEKLILNFYGETITINVPVNLETLRKIISE